MLTKLHIKARLAVISKWLTEDHNWHETAFSDEKRLSLADPDSLYRYVKGNERNIRQIRQCRGGGFLVWRIVIPSRLINHKIIRKNLNSNDYSFLLRGNQFQY